MLPNYVLVTSSQAEINQTFSSSRLFGWDWANAPGGNSLSIACFWQIINPAIKNHHDLRLSRAASSVRWRPKLRSGLKKKQGVNPAHSPVGARPSLTMARRLRSARRPAQSVIRRLDKPRQGLRNGDKWMRTSAFGKAMAIRPTIELRQEKASSYEKLYPPSSA